MPSEYPLASLALVHSTAIRPERVDGGLRLDTAFNQAGGMSQPQGEMKSRQTIHYCIQSAVTDHAYGKFEGRPWVVVAPLKEALDVNGRPESLLSSDVAFFPKEGNMVLPEAQLVEFTDAMPDDEFIRKTADGFQVSRTINDANLPQAKAWFEELSAQGAEVGLVQEKLRTPGKQWSTSEITELGVSSALAHLKKPTLGALAGVEPGAPMGFDGWMGDSALRALKRDIEQSVPGSDMGEVRLGRHDGFAGDRLMAAVARSNLDEIREVMTGPQTPSRIREAAEEWLAGDLLNQQRQSTILDELRSGPTLVANDMGQERPGMVGALFGTPASPVFDHPQLGSVSVEDVSRAIKAAPSPAVDDLKKVWDDKIQAGTPLAASFMQAQGWLTAARQVPPPLPPPVTMPGVCQWRSQREPISKPGPSHGVGIRI